MATRTPPRLIGLCSPCMQSGKSEVANALCNYGSFERLLFASPLKHMTDALLHAAGVPTLTRTRMLYGDLKDTPVAALDSATPRRIMQTLGTEWGRNIMSKGLWVGPAMEHTEALLAQGRSVVIDDVRFENEADAITARGGLLVRVVRPDAPAFPGHASEGELDGWAMPEIINDGSLQDLYVKAGKLGRGELY